MMLCMCERAIMYCVSRSSSWCGTETIIIETGLIYVSSVCVKCIVEGDLSQYCASVA